MGGYVFKQFGNLLPKENQTEVQPLYSLLSLQKREKLDGSLGCSVNQAIAKPDCISAVVPYERLHERRFRSHPFRKRKNQKPREPNTRLEWLRHCEFAYFNAGSGERNGPDASSC